MAERAEIEALKKNWMTDPCWDIETTQGFEEHVDELRAFRLEKETEWKNKQEAERNELMVRLGISGNSALLDHLLMLERRIQKLENAEDDRISKENLES